MNVKIALVLVKTLGDTVLIHNLVDGILKKFPSADIDVYINQQYINVIEHNAKIKNIKDDDDWLKNWDRILDIVASKKYTEVLIPQQLNWEDTIWHQINCLRHQHLLDYYLKRCRLPQREPEEKLQMYASLNDTEQVQKLLTLNNLKKYIVVHTTSGVPTKDWDGFYELTDRLMQQKIVVCQVGARSDKDANGKEDSATPYYVDLRSKLTFSQISVLIEKATCFLGLDSGLSYIAGTTNTPSIILQGSTVPETSGPFGNNIINILSETLPKCENVRCHAHCKYPKEVDGKCINFITVDTVESKILGVYNEEKKEDVNT